jgi:hypothetical protein
MLVASFREKGCSILLLDRGQRLRCFFGQLAVLILTGLG